MGNGASKEEQLYQAVQNGNTSFVKALRRDGASLEFVDKEGRTPLMIACQRGELFDMVLTLLNLGANVKAYQPGSHGGQPLHQAAKNGLDRTVFILLQRGADPLAPNDDVLTPLDLARNRGHLSVVRMIEDRIAIFSGMLRELPGLGFLDTFAPQWVTKKIWTVVVPTESDPRRPPKYELVIYLSPKDPLPRTLIPIGRAEVEEPKFNLPDPVLILTDKSTSALTLSSVRPMGFTGDISTTKLGGFFGALLRLLPDTLWGGEDGKKYKFLAEAPGDKAQIERLYRACKGVEQAPAGMPSQAALQGMAALIRPAAQQHQPQPQTPTPSSNTGPNSGKLKHPSEGPSDEALRMGMGSSSRTAAEEGAYPSDDKEHDKISKAETSKLGGWGDGDQASSSSFNGWGSTAVTGPSDLSRPSEKVLETELEKMPEHEKMPIPSYHQATETASTSLPLAPSTPSAPPLAPPSAPPIPLDEAGGPIFYPPIDASPIEIDYSQPAPSSAPAPKATEEKGGQCVVCWDAPAQAVCIPCGHLAGCMDCLSEIKEKGWGCPVCRTPIQQVIKVYAV